MCIAHFTIMPSNKFSCSYIRAEGGGQNFSARDFHICTAPAVNNDHSFKDTSYT